MGVALDDGEASVQEAAPRPASVRRVLTAVRRSVRWETRTRLEPAVRVESVNENAFGGTYVHVRADTVTVAVPVIPLAREVMFAVPADTATTEPPAVTVATAVLSLD